MTGPFPSSLLALSILVAGDLLCVSPNPSLEPGDILDFKDSLLLFFDRPTFGVSACGDNFLRSGSRSGLPMCDKSRFLFFERVQSLRKLWGEGLVFSFSDSLKSFDSDEVFLGIEGAWESAGTVLGDILSLEILEEAEVKNDEMLLWLGFALAFSEDNRNFIKSKVFLTIQ